MIPVAIPIGWSRLSEKWPLRGEDGAASANDSPRRGGVK